LKKILFWYGGKLKVLDRKKLFEFLCKKSFKKYWNISRSVKILNATYDNLYDFILKNLDKTSCIQIYEDFTIRLHLIPRTPEEIFLFKYEDVSKSIFLDIFDLCEDDLTFEMLEDLITFSKYN